MLCFNQMTFGFHQEPLLSNITLNIPEKHVGIVGRNGVGKTTLLRLISGELVPNSGTISTDLSTYYADSDMNKYRNFFYTDLLDMCTTMHSFTLEHVREYIESLGLQPFDHTPLGECSKGTQKKIPLLLALCSTAELLLIDEPFESVDSWSNKGFIQELQQRHGSYIIVSHDRNWLDDCVNTTYVIENRSLSKEKTDD